MAQAASGCYSGLRRYVVTFQDMQCRFALAAALPSKHARHTAKLWQMAKACYPFKPERVLSDNGSEFKAEFSQTVLNDGAVRWLTYPHCPKMNAHAERFNRTIQEEFIEFHRDLLFEDLHTFNDKLLDTLVWFNESRPHYALGMRSPMQFLAQEHGCNMSWWDTSACKNGGFRGESSANPPWRIRNRLHSLLCGASDHRRVYFLAMNPWS